MRDCICGRPLPKSKKWLRCPVCLCELEFIIPKDTADSNVNVTRLAAVLREHMEFCPAKPDQI